MGSIDLSRIVLLGRGDAMKASHVKKIEAVESSSIEDEGTDNWVVRVTGIDGFVWFSDPKTLAECEVLTEEIMGRVNQALTFESGGLIVAD